MAGPRPDRSPPLIVLLTADRVAETAEVLARAFHDDPLFSALWPDPGRRRRTLGSIFRAQARLGAELRSSYVALDGRGRVRGSSIWIEPDMRKSVTQLVREAVSAWPALATWRTAVTGARLFLAIDRLRPDAPHWYLEVLAVDPGAQGSGVGRELIDVGLRAADRQGVAVYLETSKEANLAWYHRFGFEIQETVQLTPSIPPAWTLLRAPGASDDAA